MRRIRIFEMPSLYREPMVITGYRFGKGEKSAAIVGAMRGNEIQQLYICSQLVRRLKMLEKEGLRQPVFREHRKAFLGDGRHRRQSHVSRL